MLNSNHTFFEVIYNEFHIDFKIPFHEQIENLAEDLIQMQSNNGFFIDVGWYPEHNPNGCIKIMLVKDYAWENPILEFETTTEIGVRKAIRASILHAS